MNHRHGLDAREGLPADVVTGLEDEGLLAPEQHDAARRALDERARDRSIDWVSGTVLQGDVLAAFAEHCRRDLDDIEVEAADATTLTVRWRAEVSRFELRNGFFGIEHLAAGTPTMLLGDIEPRLDDLVRAFLDDPGLRARLAVCDLGRLERIGWGEPAATGVAAAAGAPRVDIASRLRAMW